MPIDTPELFGTEKDGAPNSDYCKYCYANGEFTNPGLTLEEMKDHMMKHMEKEKLPEDIIEIAPRSCKTSSAAMVSARIRDSANATSSGMFLERWWQTISMSRCSSSVLRVKGLVGLVDEGRTFSCSTTLMMSGA